MYYINKQVSGSKLPKRFNKKISQDFEKRFYGATNEDVVKNVRNYVNARENWHEKRQNNIKATSQINSKFMLGEVLLNNKRNEPKPISYSPAKVSTEQEERRVLRIASSPRSSS